MTGDGDALSIGGNHLIHALRRNVPVKILLFNNQIYGLTKGQASPTSRARQGHQVDAVRLDRRAVQPARRWRSAPRRRSSRARSTRDKQHLPAVLRAAAAHEGAALVEIYQNCPVFNDGAFDALRDKKQRRGQPHPRSSTASRSASARRASTASRAAPDGDLRIVDVADVGEDALVVHDAHRDDPSLAFALVAPVARAPDGPTPIGIFRAVERPLHGAAAARNADRAVADWRTLDALLHAGDTWTVA